MSYELTFEEVVKMTLFEGNKGMFQGENFKRGCYLQADNDVLSLYEYLLDDSGSTDFFSWLIDAEVQRGVYKAGFV